MFRSVLRLALLATTVGTWPLALEPAWAQQIEPPLDLDAICLQTKCRPPITVRLSYDKERVVEVSLPRAPIAFKGVVNLIAGERLYVEAREQDGKLVEMHVVDQVEKPESTIELKLEQLEQSKEHPGMMMTVRNPYRKVLKYRAGIHPAGKDRFYKTSICPIHPGTSSFESWPYPIVQIVLTDFQLTEARKDMEVKCE